MSSPAPSVAVSDGRSHFGDVVERFDELADAWLEPIREQPVLARVFSTASHLGDWSLIWHLAGTARGVLLRRPDQVVALAAALGVESLVVNQGIKRLFRRTRPTETGDSRLPVRRPRTSSFPSGHASSAAFAAVILIGWDGRRSAIVWLPIAATVAASRVVVRIHHASDVLGGTATGVILGLVARAALRRIGIRH